MVPRLPPACYTYIAKSVGHIGQGQRARGLFRVCLPSFLPPRPSFIHVPKLGRHSLIHTRPRGHRHVGGHNGAFKLVLLLREGVVKMHDFCNRPSMLRHHFGHETGPSVNLPACCVPWLYLWKYSRFKGIDCTLLMWSVDYICYSQGRGEQ